MASADRILQILGLFTPARPAWTPQRALEFVEEGTGTSFDAGIARAFAAMMRRLEGQLMLADVPSIAG